MSRRNDEGLRIALRQIQNPIGGNYGDYGGDGGCVRRTRLQQNSYHPTCQNKWQGPNQNEQGGEIGRYGEKHIRQIGFQFVRCGGEKQKLGWEKEGDQGQEGGWQSLQEIP